MEYELVFRSKYGVATTFGVGLVGLFIIGFMWAGEGAIGALTGAVLPIVLTYFTWWMWAWPSVIVSDAGIEVRNQVRTMRIGWDSFVQAESNLGLYLLVNPGPGNQLGAAWNSPGQRGNRDGTSRIFCAGVPARGGLAMGRSKEAPTVPELYFERGPRITLRVEPRVAALMLDEEKTYQGNSGMRPSNLTPSPQAIAGWAQRSEWQKRLGGELTIQDRFAGVTTATNWGILTALAVLAAGAFVYGFWL